VKYISNVSGYILKGAKEHDNINANVNVRYGCQLKGDKEQSDFFKI
jgi:hypothetical protein